MAANLAKWPSNRGLISKIRPSDGCKGDTVPSTVVRGYDLRKPGGHLGNVGSMVDLVARIEKVLGREIAKTVIEYPDSYRAIEPMRRCPDISKAMLELDYHPRVGLDEGLGRYLAWTEEVYTGEG